MASAEVVLSARSSEWARMATIVPPHTAFLTRSSALGSMVSVVNLDDHDCFGVGGLHINEDHS